MLDFLKDYLDNEDLKIVKENIKGSEALNLNCNQDECLEIINYLKSKKLDIKDLLINKTDLFFKNLDEVKLIIDNLDEI